MREVVATLQQQKPYLFVHEANLAKGGGPLNALRLELIVDYRDDLFDGRRVTEWHRILAFQVVSLLQIAEDMLRFSAIYQSKPETLRLSMPGSLLEQKLMFPSPVMLYVSDNNPGAAEAMTEMRSAFADLGLAATLPQLAASRRGSWGSRRPTMRIGGSLKNIRIPVEGQTRLTPTHFLLYLNQQTYLGRMGNALVDEIRTARRARLPIVLVHENDAEKHGCEFGTFFRTTPQDLIDGGLYKAIAIAFMSGEAHRKVSRALLAKDLGARARSALQLRSWQSSLVRRTSETTTFRETAASPGWLQQRHEEAVTVESSKV